MRKIFVLVFILIIVPINSLIAQDKETTKVELEQMKEMVEQLQDKIEKLEAQYKTDKPSEKSDTVVDKKKVKSPDKQKLQVIERDNLNDMQTAAPRPYDLSLLREKYNGFIPIPYTKAMIRFNASPRVDFTNDNTNTGNENKFVTADIPVSGEADKGGGYHFNINAQGTRLSMDVRAPGIDGSPRFYYENDFAGSGTAYLNYRVRHLYGLFYNIVLGQTYTVFEDADAWPDTLDYEGPNSAISSRRPLLQYMIMPNDYWGIGISIEKPTPKVDTSIDPTATSQLNAPEGGFQVKWMNEKYGHIQFSTIFRNLGVKGTIVGDQDVFGWGASLSANINLFKKDSFQTMLTYGEGIFYFINDATENGDAAFNSRNQLQALPVVALMAGYTHYWGGDFRSTGSFGFVNLGNETSQTGDSYHRTYYGSLNLVYQMFKRLSFGVEGLYGYNQVKSHASGQAWRGQFTVTYKIFK